MKGISFKELKEDVKKVNIPTLHISCEDDTFIQKKVRDFLQTSIPDFTIKTLKGKSHYIYKTHKDELNQHIADYLNFHFIF